MTEREKISVDKKLEQVGLEVLMNVKQGPYVVFQRVHSEITPDEFMDELYELYLKECMNLDAFKKGIRL